MNVHTRRVYANDAPALLAVRAAVRENPFSLEALAAAGITAESVARGLAAGTRAGWLCEADAGVVVGFALADLPAGELWVLAVLPGYEGQGIGRDLLARTEALIREAGHAAAWLWTSPDRGLRACRLYLATGWREEQERDGRLYLRKLLA